MEPKAIAEQVEKLLKGEARGAESIEAVMALFNSNEALGLLSEMMGEPRRLIVMEQVFAAVALPLWRGELPSDTARRLVAYSKSFGTASITLLDAKEYVAFERVPDELDPAANIFKSLVIPVVMEDADALVAMRRLIEASDGKDLNAAVALATRVDDHRVQRATQNVLFEEGLTGVKDALTSYFECYADLLEPYIDVTGNRN